MSAVITLIAGAFVMRLDDWSRGINSEFVVHGQTAPGGGGSGSTAGCGTGTSATGSSSASFSRIIPQIAVGTYGASKYITTIQVINVGTSAVKVCGDFFQRTGIPSVTGYTTLVNNVSGRFSAGSLAATSLPVNGVLVITGASDAAGQINWARISASGSVIINCVFELRDTATNVLKSRVGVAPSVDNMKQFVIPRMRNVAAGFDVGFAIVNTGTTDAMLTGTLRDANGVALKVQTVPLKAKAQTAIFANEFFALGAEAGGATTSHTYMTFDSTSPSFAAIALAFEGDAQASFPVTQLQ